MNINWKVRAKNPVFWIGIVSMIVTTVLAYNNMQPTDVTTWHGVAELAKGMFANPFLLLSVLINIWNSVYDPTTAGVSDSAQALTYEEPKKSV